MIEGRFDRTGQNRAILSAQSDIITAQASIVASQAIHNSRISVKLSAAQSVVSATPTKINFNTKLYDGLTEWDAATNYRFQPKVTGYYCVTANLFWAVMNGGYNVILYWYINGANFKATVNSTAGGIQPAVCSAIDLYLLSTDYLELWASFSDVGPRNLDKDNSWFTVHRFA